MTIVLIENIFKKLYVINLCIFQSILMLFVSVKCNLSNTFLISFNVSINKYYEFYNFAVLSKYLKGQIFGIRRLNFALFLFAQKSPYIIHVEYLMKWIGYTWRYGQGESDCVSDVHLLRCRQWISKICIRYFTKLIY